MAKTEFSTAIEDVEAGRLSGAFNFKEKEEIDVQNEKDIPNANAEPLDAESADEIIDIEEYAKAGRKPPRAKACRIRIDKQHYTVEVPAMTGRELLTLAGKTPVTSYMISQKLRGGEASKIGYAERADFTAPGVERFMTLPLDQTEGC